MSRPNCVFVGNIPQDSTEQQLESFFARMGQVIQFKIIYDKESRLSKGYGFCEYVEVEAAQSAAKNLNGADIQGQQIRVDLADAERQSTADLTSHQYATMKTERREPHIREREALDLHTQLAAEDIVPNGVICEVMEGLSDNELYLLLAHMKQLALNDPDAARELLTAYPQLSFALLHGQMMSNMRQNPRVNYTKEDLRRLGVAQQQQNMQGGMMGRNGPGKLSAPAIESITIEQRKLLIAKLAQLNQESIVGLHAIMKQQILGYLSQKVD